MSNFLYYVPFAMLFTFVAGLPGLVLQWFLWKHWRKQQLSSPLLSAWVELQKELADTLHHPHPESKEMDRLLETLQTFTASGLSLISVADRTRLTLLLRQTVDNEKEKEVERVCAQFLLFVMPRALKEQQNKNLVRGSAIR